MNANNFSLKNLLLFVFIFSALISGCVKKRRRGEEDGKKIKKVAQNIAPETFAIDLKEGNLELSGSDKSTVPLYEETEDFFDDEDLSEFALASDEVELELDDFKDVTTPEESTELSLSETEKPEEQDFVLDLLEQEDIDNELIALQEDEFGDDYEFKTLHFDLNKFALKEGQTDLLTENINAAKSAVDQGKEIIIQGHCCQLGEAGYNLALSEKRANTIKKILVENGIPAEKIRTIGLGQEMPLVWSDSKDKNTLIEDLSVNRRGEILVN